ncbi:MAG: glycoside hydrolase family 13 protein [Oscillospiraceae bacterium]|nr:glycoside hydrolase family 13 protein [Oscillospiraceae bacterium]
MLIQHQAALPLCYYDKELKKVIIKLITGVDIKAAVIMLGDPFEYELKADKAGTKKDPEKSDWKWVHTESPLHKQYSSGDKIMWRGEITPPPTKRLKYAFALTCENGSRIFYSEKGPEPYTDESIYQRFIHFHYPFIHEIDAPHTPSWVKDTIWYQIFPERFCNGKPSISPPKAKSWDDNKPKSTDFYGGDLYGIIEKLPYIKDLGFTGIYMTPVFESPTNHKYDTQDYYSIDKHFGDKDTLKKLVKKAHELGIKVMLDAVFNHIGSKHVFWQDVLKNQEKSKYKDYFHIHSFPVLPETEYKNKKDLNFYTFAFTPRMPKWNTENPDARKYLIDVALYWIKECNIDGWRMDVSDEVSFSFWHDFNEAVSKEKKDFYILGELWHDPSKWFSNGSFDAVMNYPLGWDICDFFQGKNTDPDVFTHAFSDKLMRLSDLHNGVQFNLLDSHDTARLLTRAGGDKHVLRNCFMFMFFMKGSPCVYYGTEIGLEGDDDPDCRRPMIWDEAKQDLDLQKFFKDLIILRKKYNKLVQNAVISYTKEGSICRWDLSHKNEQIILLYNSAKNDTKVELNVLLSTSERKNDINILPGKTLAICDI